MKYLIIATVVSLVLAFIYVRIRPYLRLISKVVQSFKVVTDISASTASPPQRTPSRNKLVRCDHCGTWIPAERALSLHSGLATFCSADCMEKKAAGKERKLAG